MVDGEAGVVDQLQAVVGQLGAMVELILEL